MEFRPLYYRSACARLDLFARDYAGEGPALLLMHGLTRNSADFEPLVHHLYGRYRLLVPDQRGRGLSEYDPQPENYRPDVYANDMLALLREADLEQVSAIGTSMGGLVAMAMAAIEPDCISAAVLNDVGPELSSAGLERIASYVGPNACFATWSDAASHCAMINNTVFPDFEASDWMAFAKRTCVETATGEVTFAYDPGIVATIAEAPQDSPDLWPLWHALDGKAVLVLRGALSDLLTPEAIGRMRQAHEGMFVHCDIPNRGHAPLLNEPEALRAIDSFLELQGG